MNMKLIFLNISCVIFFVIQLFCFTDIYTDTDWYKGFIKGPYFNKAYIGSGGGIDEHLVDLIDSAKSTLDMCFYQCNHIPIRDAILRAKKRGVRIRFITDEFYYTRNDYYNKFYKYLEEAGITVINERFTHTSPDDHQMHDKFCIVDKLFVWTGSYNITKSCTNENNNNAMLFKSNELAENYLREFNQMWGSEGDKPDADVSLFGNDKNKVSKNIFNINGVLLENYFSPYDNLNNKIANAVNSADSNIYFCIFVFSDDVIGNAIGSKLVKGTTVAGVFDDMAAERNISQYHKLKKFGANLRIDINIEPHGKIMHDKFLVVDWNNPNSDPLVVMGSHNWTDAANERNEENIIIIHDENIAKEYYKEFLRIFWGNEPIKDVDSQNLIDTSAFLNIDFDNKINVNVATLKDLEKLPGIGKVIGARIIEYRDKVGKINDLEELKNIEGIGEGRFNKIEEKLKTE